MAMRMIAWSRFGPAASAGILGCGACLRIGALSQIPQAVLAWAMSVPVELLCGSIVRLANVLRVQVRRLPNECRLEVQAR